jgi:hypothetical protein
METKKASCGDSALVASHNVGVVVHNIIAEHGVNRLEINMPTKNTMSDSCCNKSESSLPFVRNDAKLTHEFEAKSVRAIESGLSSLKSSSESRVAEYEDEDDQGFVYAVTHAECVEEEPYYEFLGLFKHLGTAVRCFVRHKIDCHYLICSYKWAAYCATLSGVEANTGCIDADVFESEIVRFGESVIMDYYVFHIMPHLSNLRPTDAAAKVTNDIADMFLREEFNTIDDGLNGWPLYGIILVPAAESVARLSRCFSVSVLQLDGILKNIQSDLEAVMRVVFVGIFKDLDVAVDALVDHLIGDVFNYIRPSQWGGMVAYPGYLQESDACAVDGDYLDRIAPDEIIRFGRLVLMDAYVKNLQPELRFIPNRLAAKRVKEYFMEEISDDNWHCMWGNFVIDVGYYEISETKDKVDSVTFL